MGHIISGYIDGSYHQPDTCNECAQNVTASAKLITELGFIRHIDKSGFLGFFVKSLKYFCFSNHIPVLQRLGTKASNVPKLQQ